VCEGDFTTVILFHDGHLAYKYIRMENVTEGQVSFGANAMAKWSALWFVPHLFAVYIVANFCTPQLAGWTHNTLLPFPFAQN
jgi:hypothetical protein